MARYSASEIRHGPVRWLLRICGWFCLIGGIAGLIFGGDRLFLYFSEISGALITGVICVGLDILVSMTDPDRKRNRTSAQAAVKSAIRKDPQLRQLDDAYRQILKALPTEDNGALLVRLTRQYGTAELVQRTKSDESFCQVLFLTNPSRQTLEFIYSHNPVGAYKVCLEILKAAQRTKEGGASQPANRSSMEDKYSNSFDKFTK